MPEILSPYEVGDIVTILPRPGDGPFEVTRRHRTQNDPDEHGYNAYYLSLQSINNPEISFGAVHINDVVGAGANAARPRVVFIGTPGGVAGKEYRRNIRKLYEKFDDFAVAFDDYNMRLSLVPETVLRDKWYDVEDYWMRVLVDSSSSLPPVRKLVEKLRKRVNADYASLLTLCRYRSYPVWKSDVVCYRTDREWRALAIPNDPRHSFLSVHAIRSETYAENPIQSGIYVEVSRLRDLQHQLIRNYSFDVLAVHDFQAMPGEVERLERSIYSPLYLGVELEVGTNGAPWNMPQLTLDALQYAILKRDASIGQGFEIVTAPATLAFHKEMWKPYFADGGPAQHTTPTRACGMHVHMNRNAMSPLTLGKLLHFFNDRKNARQISEVAGRNVSDQPYVHFHPGKKVTSVLERDGDRYQVLSTSREHTVECRIFASTKTEKGFFGRLEFCAASVEFARASSTKQLYFEHFLDWLRKNRGGFPYLTKYLKALGYDVKGKK